LKSPRASLYLIVDRVPFALSFAPLDATAAEYMIEVQGFLIVASLRAVFVEPTTFWISATRVAPHLSVVVSTQAENI
jgi:hypothetical protein